MSLHSYLLFVVASIVLVFVPGPDMAYLLARSLAQGKRAGVLAALGINAGAYVHLIAAVTGLSALLMASALAFTVFKVAGALYLVWLGVQALRARSSETPLPNIELKGAGAGSVFWQGFLSDALNPKVAMFYLAFLPQFVNANASGVWAGRPWLQFLVLGLTCNMIALPFNIPIALAAGHISEALRRSPRVGTWLQRAMGVTFVGLGVRLAAERTPAAVGP
jgi:threonine/homoserine/homoserine lactone efflux protein